MRPKRNLNIITTVVFDWDNTLSHQRELGNPNRTLAFPRETENVFRTLQTLGVRIIIASQQTEKEVIEACLFSANLQVNEIISKRQDRVQLLENIAKSGFESSQICLVDDSNTSRRNAQDNGFKSIPVECGTNHRTGEYIKSSTHLISVIKMCLTDPVKNAIKNAISFFEDYQEKQPSRKSTLFGSTSPVPLAVKYKELIRSLIYDEDQTKRLSKTPNKSDTDKFEYYRLSLIYLILANNQGKDLQRMLSRTMGFKNVYQAKHYFLLEIKNRLKEYYPDEDEYQTQFDWFEAVMRTIVGELRSDDKNYYSLLFRFKIWLPNYTLTEELLQEQEKKEEKEAQVGAGDLLHRWERVRVIMKISDDDRWKFDIRSDGSIGASGINADGKQDFRVRCQLANHLRSIGIKINDSGTQHVGLSFTVTSIPTSAIDELERTQKTQYTTKL